MNTQEVQPMSAAPEGYMFDSKQRMVPITMVDDYDMEINDFVIKHTAKAREIQSVLRQFKRDVFDDCYAEPLKGPAPGSHQPIRSQMGVHFEIPSTGEIGF